MRVSTVVFVLLLVSCSTLKKSIIYSALSGGMVGATSGAILSPDKPSQGANAVVFGLIGAGVAALAGYALYQDDPRNYKLNSMLLPEEKRPLPDEVDIGLGNINIQAKLQEQEGYKVPLGELPDKLKGKVKQQYLIKYQSKERYVTNGSRTFYIPSFEVYEHSYDEKLEGANVGQEKE